MVKITRKKLIEILLWIAATVATIGIGLGLGQWIASCRRNDLLDKRLTFHVQKASGKDVSPADFVGKPIVVNFWAIWCEPCKMELPYFQDAYDDYKGEVEFMLINEVNFRGNTVAQVEAFMEQYGYDFPVYYDTRSEASKSCSVSSIPLTLFIDKEGKVAYTYSGMISKALLYSYIEKIVD